MNDTRRRHSADQTAEGSKQEINQLLNQYRQGDEVVFKNSSGDWQVGKLDQIPEAVKGKGKTTFRFKVEGVGSVTVDTLPKKYEGADLIREMKSRPIIMNGKEYVPGQVKFGPNGEEEYSLVSIDESGKRKPGRIQIETQNYVDVETLRNIFEAARAAEHIQAQVHDLLEEINTLQGTKVKELLQGATRLESRSTDLLKILGTENEWNKLDEEEVRAMNGEIRRLRGEIDISLRKLKADIEEHQEKHGVDKETTDHKELADKIRTAYDKKMKVADRTFDIAEKDKIKAWEAWEEYDRKEADWQRQTAAAQQQNRGGRGRSQLPSRPIAPRAARPTTKPVKPSTDLEIKNQTLDTVLDELKRDGVNVDSFKNAVNARMENDEEMLRLLSPNDLPTYQRLASERDQLQTKESELRLELTRLLAAEALAESTLEDLRQQKERLEQDRQAINNSSAPEIVEMNQQYAELGELEKSEQDLSDEDKRLEQEIGDLEQQDSSLETELEDLKREIDLIDRQIKKLEKSKSKGGKKTQDELDEIDAKIKIEQDKKDSLVIQKDEKEVQRKDLAQEKQQKAERRSQITADLQQISTKKGVIDKRLDILQNAPAIVRALEINKRLKEIPGEQQVLQSELQQISQERGQFTTQLADIPNELVSKEKEMGNIIEQSGNIAEYRGQQSFELLGEWEKLEVAPDSKFNFDKEREELNEQITKLKESIRKISHRSTVERLEKKLAVCEDELDKVKKRSPTLERDLLKMWENLGKLEVEIYAELPRALEGELKEAHEAREGRLVTAEVPSAVLKDLLETRKKELTQVVDLIYSRTLKRGKEEGVDIIYADPTVTEALKNLFDEDFEPPSVIANRLRSAGIKDWRQFKNLWDEQYASQVGLILQEDAQLLVSRELERRLQEQAAEQEEYERKEEEFNQKNWLSRKIFSKEKPVPPDNHSTEAELREAVIEELLNKEKENESISFSKFTRLMGTAMREVNLELLVAEAPDDAARAAILKKAGREADDYVLYNGQFFIKNGDERMLRKEGLAMESLSQEELAQIYKEIRFDFASLDSTLSLLDKRRPVSKTQKEQLHEQMGEIQEALRGEKTADVVLSLMLAQDFMLQDQAKDLVYEYQKFKERERITEDFRAARKIVVDKGNEIQAEDKAAEGVVETIVKKAEAEAAQEAANYPKGKRDFKSWAKKSALVAAFLGGWFTLGVGGHSLFFQDHKGHDHSAFKEQVVKKSAEPPRGAEQQKPTKIDHGVVKGGEVRPGSIAEKKSTTTSVAWRIEKMNDFNEAAKKVFNDPKSGSEVLAATSTVKDIIFGIPDDSQRGAAIRGLYSLLDGVMQKNSVDSIEQLKNVLSTSDVKNVTDTLVSIGNAVKPDADFMKVPSETRSDSDMVREAKSGPNQPSDIDSGTQEFKEAIKVAFKNEKEGADARAVMRWAPLVLKEYLKLYPAYIAGNTRAESKERLNRILFDVSYMLAVIKKESTGNTHSISSKNAMGLAQIMPSTVREHCQGINLSDPAAQIDCGFAEILDKSNRHGKGDLYGTLIAYNAGAYSDSFANYQKDHKPSEYALKVVEWTEKYSQDHGWFNELLKDKQFEFLRQDLKKPSPEVALTPGTAKIGGVATGETKPGNVEGRTLTTTAVEFQGGMMEKLDTVTGTIYKGENTESVLEKTSGIKDLIQGMDNKPDRDAAVKGLYSLINQAGAEGGEAAQKNLKEILDLAGSKSDKDNQDAVKKLVEAGRPLVKPPTAPRTPRPRASNA